MKRLRLADMPLIAKIGFAPMLALLMLVLTATIAVVAQNHIVADLQKAVNTGMAKSLQVEDISARITETHGRLYMLLTHQAGQIEPEKIAAQSKKLVADLTRIETDIAALKKTAPAAQKPVFTRLQKQMEATRSAADLVGSMMTADFSAAASFIDPFEHSYREMLATLSQVVSATKDATYARVRASEAAAHHMQLLLGGVALLTFLIVLIVTIISAYATRRDILRLAAATEKLAAGDNSIHLSHLARKDELGAIVRSLTVFRDNQLRLIEMRRENEAAREARAREVTQVITALGEGMEHLAACDFSYRLSEDFPEEYRMLATAFNESMGELENTLQVITSVTTEIQAESGQSISHVAGKTASLKKTGEALVAALHAFRENAAAADQRRQKRHAAEAESAREQAAVVEMLGAGLNNLSSGDLTQKISGDFPPEYLRLREDFNAALSRLESTLIRVHEVTGVLRAGTDDVNSAVDELSHRTEHQAATLEETAASLNQITATVKSTADGAASASNAIAKAKQDALTSGQVVKDTVEAMHEIKTSADQISQIVGAIDEITFQTNLLSLNASVEAARAGEAGKGFAVVATEVRELSHRTANMAKEIKKLITASEQRVHQGVNLVEETGRTIERIVGQIVDINDVINQIANSAREQSSGLEQINIAVTDMDTVTQQNSAMVQETTNSSRTLAKQAEELSELIARFHVHTAGSTGATVSKAIRAVPAERPLVLAAAASAASAPASRATVRAMPPKPQPAASAAAPKRPALHTLVRPATKPAGQNGHKVAVAPVSEIHTPQQTAHEILQRMAAKRHADNETRDIYEDDTNDWKEF